MRKAILLSTAAMFLAAGCATMPAKAVAPKERTGMIASRIIEAEQLGAKLCAPKTLAKVKVALEHVTHELEEGYYPPSWLAPDIAAVEKAAEELLAERKYAATLGTRFRCVSAPHTEPGGTGSREGG